MIEGQESEKSHQYGCDCRNVSLAGNRSQPAREGDRKEAAEYGKEAKRKQITPDEVLPKIEQDKV